MFWCTLLYVHSSFAINLIGNRELVALISVSYRCLMVVVWIFLAASWVCLQFLIVIFPDHTHLLIFTKTVEIIWVQLNRAHNSDIKASFWICICPFLMILFLSISSF